MSDHKSDISDYDIATNVEDTEVDQIIKVSFMVKMQNKWGIKGERKSWVGKSEKWKL